MSKYIWIGVVSLLLVSGSILTAPESNVEVTVAQGSICFIVSWFFALVPSWCLVSWFRGETTL